jgi:hypothetical protein
VYGVSQRLLDEFFDTAAPDLGTEERRMIEAVAPPRPVWISRDAESGRRWVAASLTAAAIALDLAPEDPAQAIHFAFDAARQFYGDQRFVL